MSTATTSTSFHSFPSNHIPPRGIPRHSPSSHVTFRQPLPSVSAVYTTVDDRTHNSISTPSFLQNTSSFYELLGVQDGATCQEIKAAYRKLARALHPDVTASSSNGVQCATSADEFIRVNEAYTTLSDPSKRADYDKMLFFKRRRFGGSSPNYYYSMGAKTRGTTSSCYSGRTWETDQCW